MASALKEPDVLILAFSLCYIENEVDSLLIPLLREIPRKQRPQEYVPWVPSSS